MPRIDVEMLFENYVNYAGSKTSLEQVLLVNMFENYVNYAGSKTRTTKGKYEVIV